MHVKLKLIELNIPSEYLSRIFRTYIITYICPVYFIGMFKVNICME